MGGAPGALLRCHKPTEVPRRARIARGPGRRQQPLRRDPALGGLDPRTDQLDHPVVVALSRLALWTLTTHAMPLDDPPDRLGCGATHLGGPAVATHLTVGGDDVHLFPRRLQYGVPWAVWRLVGTTTITAQAQAPNRHDKQGW